MRRPIVTKGYICVFVSFTVKAVHIEPVTDLTTVAFIATLRRFIARRGKPKKIWSDHGTNFVGAARELKELYAYLRNAENQNSIATLCSQQGIEWTFTPEHAPHFGGLWEAAVKSFKHHFRRIIGSTRLTFEVADNSLHTDRSLFKLEATDTSSSPRRRCRSIDTRSFPCWEPP